ncbi:MAG: glycosyl hydrolase, partial [Planctomycetota bacterium]
HDMWIAPSDPTRMIESNDGGANVSFDSGATWSEQKNQPTSQIYRVSVDNAMPYRLLGGQQDNSALRIRSSSSRGGRPGLRDWEPTAGGESGHVVAHPANPDLVFGGSYGGYLSMVDHANGQRRSVTVWPDNPMGYGAEGMKYRFQWNFPLFFSPFGDPEAEPGAEESYALYAASNVLFRSTDLGASWQQISPDLTRNDPEKLGPSGGPITKDNTGVEYYCTIFAAFESPLQRGVIWCGSDDGRVHVTQDDGASWTEVTPEGLPEWTQINDMVADPFNPGGAYLAGTRYKLDDFAPYLYHTTDFGQSWTKITDGIPGDHFTRAIEADSERRGLLFAGTERGLYVSMDDGASWSSFQQGLPTVPVTDLAFGGRDLVASTQGRGFWVLDDLAPLRQLSLSAHVGNSVLYAPDDVTRAGYDRGVSIDYIVAEGVEELALTIKNYDGEVIRRFVPKGKGPKAPHAAEKDDVLPADAGFHRFTWNLRAKGAESFPKMVLWSGRMGGPTVPPGRYRVELSVDGETVDVPLLITSDPRSDSTTMDLVAQYNFAMETGAVLTRAHSGIRSIRSVRSDLSALKKRLPEDEENEPVASLISEIDAVLETMKSVEETLYQTKNQSRQDPLNFPIRLTDKLSGVRGGAMQGEFAPTAQMIAVAEELSSQINAEMDKLDDLLESKIPAIDEAARALDLPLVEVPD